jgi:hypothetical protein
MGRLSGVSSKVSLPSWILGESVKRVPVVVFFSVNGNGNTPYDLIPELPKGVHTAIYADDLVLWCTEEYAATANYRMQIAI